MKSGTDAPVSVICVAPALELVQYQIDAVPPVVVALVPAWTKVLLPPAALSVTLVGAVWAAMLTTIRLPAAVAGMVSGDAEPDVRLLMIKLTYFVIP